MDRLNWYVEMNEMEERADGGGNGGGETEGRGRSR